jgi:hypothetical protein
LITSRVLRPEPSALVVVPTNMHFVVRYALSGAAAGRPDWLGDITARGGPGDEPIPVDVVRLPDADGAEIYDVIPRAPLAPSSSVSLYDRFAAVPCGYDAACERAEPARFASFETAPWPDLQKPHLIPATTVVDDWEAFTRLDCPTSSVCHGFQSVAPFAAAADNDTPVAGITYRRRYEAGKITESPGNSEVRSYECPCGYNHVTVSELPTVHITAVDWMGHESDEEVVISYKVASCDADAGPSGGDPSPRGQGAAAEEGGCAVGGPGGPAGAAWLLVFLYAATRPLRRGRCRPSRDGRRAA